MAILHRPEARLLAGIWCLRSSFLLQISVAMLNKVRRVSLVEELIARIISALRHPTFHHVGEDYKYARQ